MSRKSEIIACLLVGTLSALPFLRSSDYDAVSIDDYDYVVEHRQITEGFRAADPAWMFTNTSHGIFMPLTWLSYMADYAVSRSVWTSGDDPDVFERKAFGVMHVHSALLHGANASLVFIFLALLFPGAGWGRTVALLAASLFWGCHPLRTESVVWIASRKDLVSFFFLILSLISWVRFRQGEKPFYSARCYWLALLLLVLGSLGKPSVMVFPGLVAVLDWVVQRKFDLKTENRWNVAAVLPYLLPTVVGLLIAVEAAWFQNAGGAMEGTTPLWARIVNACVSYGVYIRNTVFPNRLAAQCLVQYPGLPHFFLGGMAIFAVCMVYFHRRYMALRKNGFGLGKPDLLLCAMLWFFGSLVPFIGIAGFGSHAFADRFTYIPALGISIALAGSLSAKNRLLPSLATLAASILLGGVAWWQTGFWKDERTMWERTLAIDGDRNVIANVCMGQYHFEVDHDVRKAIDYFERGFAVDPEYTIWFGIAYMNSLSEAGEATKAFEFYKYFQGWNRQRMAAKETNDDPFNDRIVMGADFMTARVAMLMADGNHLKSAEEDLGKLSRVHPHSPHVLYLRARLEELKGDSKAAIEIYRQVVEDSVPDGTFVRYRFLKDRLASLKKED